MLFIFTTLTYLRSVSFLNLEIESQHLQRQQRRMPYIAANMATPIDSSSQIFVLPDPDTVFNHMRNDANRKYKILKCIELVFALFSLVFFTIGDVATENTAKDMAVNACLGAITIYPLICMAFSLSFYKSPRKMLVFNILNSLLLFTLSTLILSSWWQIEEALDEMGNKYPKVYFEGQLSATWRFAAALAGVINGVIYTSESLVMALEMKGYV